VLLGREAECARLEALLAGVRQGRSGALVIRGEPGVGKSALLRFAVERATGLAVLSAAPVQAESELAFSGLADLLRPVSSLLSAIPRAQAAALAGALAIAAPVAGDRFAICAASLSLLAAAAEQRPLLAIVDDLHWLDAASAEALLFAARRLHAEGIGLLFGLREEEGTWLDLSGIADLRLVGIDRASSASLVAETSARPPVPGVADALHVATDGNPLALIEIAGLLTDDQLAGRDSLPDPLPVGPGLERAFRWQIERLSDRSRQALLVAAAYDSQEMDTIAQALEVLDGDPAAFGAAEDARLVRIKDGRIQFRHPLLRSAIYNLARPAERRAAHAALGEALARQGATNRCAWHRAAATLGPDEDIARALEEAGMTAQMRSGYAAAAKAFERAGQLSPSVEARSRRFFRAAQAHQLTGHPDRGSHLLLEVVNTSPDPMLRAQAQMVLGQIEGWRGDPMAAHALLVSAAREIEDQNPAMAAMILVNATLLCFMAANTVQAVATAEQALAIGNQTDSFNDALGAVLLEQARLQHGEALPKPAVAERALALFGSAPELAFAVVTFVPFYLIHSEEDEKARELLKGLIDQARRMSAPALLPHPLACLSELEFRAGSWMASYASAFESITLATQTGQENSRSYGLICLARTEAAMGREAECRAHLTSSLELARRFGLDATLSYVYAGLGFLELSLGHPERALDHLREDAALLDAKEVRDPNTVPFRADLVEANIRTGQLDEARGALAILEQQAEQSGRIWAQAAAARCRGLLADEHGFEKEFRTALAHHDKIRMPFELARTELCFGEMLRRYRHRSEARQHLRVALQAFEELGAEPWAARARNELMATGESVRPRRAPVSHRLTPQELQVSLAIAGGATNREAAAHLFLSPKTIEAHLRSVYAKLDVRSRTELARLFASRGAEVASVPISTERTRKA
jgi:DNA-binding CsgD family transcriptional regulator